MVENEIKQKLLIRIVLGAAWADGKLEPNEISYLHQILSEQALTEDPEIQTFFHEAPSDYQMELWLVQYLSATDVPERLGALAQIANLLMADGVVSSAEHDFLDEIHTLMAQIPPRPENLHKSTTDNLLSSLGKIMRRLVKSTQK